MQELSSEILLDLQGGDRAAKNGDCGMYVLGLTFMVFGGLMLGGAGLAFALGFTAGVMSSDSNPC